MIAALLLWPLAAFGGRDAATAIPAGLACIAFALYGKPRRLTGFDVVLIGLVASVCVQLLPLPAPVLDVLSPNARTVRAALALAPAARGARAMTIDFDQTVWALAVFGGAVALFVAARRTFRQGGVRRSVRAVSALGFGFSLLALAQAATAGRSIYWRFATEVEGPLPFGPFVNRNHFATWAIMALPLTFGYIAARTGAHRRQPGSARARAASAIEGRSIWLGLAAAAMSAALLLSLSRSGAIALTTAAVVTLGAVRARIDRRHATALLGAVIVAGACAAGWADLPALGRRFATVRASMADRVTIWRETLPVVRDFILTGTGAGTYQTAMRVYQRSDRRVYFNQAHNHYLQAMSEGGLLAVLPFGAALVLLVREGRRAIALDRTAMVWLRIGAACGLFAAALQSLWETGLVMPANAALAAVLAAVLLHAREPEAGG